MCNGFEFDNDCIVRLSIGGYEFSTTYGTVTNGRSKLLTDAARESLPAHIRAAAGNQEAMFFDNDASAFHIFLNFLRHGKLIVSDIEFDRLGEQLKFDAEFYDSEDFANAVAGKAAEKASAREAADKDIAIKEASGQRHQEAMVSQMQVVTALGELQAERQLQVVTALGQLQAELKGALADVAQKQAQQHTELIDLLQTTEEPPAYKEPVAKPSPTTLKTFEELAAAAIDKAKAAGKAKADLILPNLPDLANQLVGLLRANGYNVMYNGSHFGKIHVAIHL